MKKRIIMLMLAVSVLAFSGCKEKKENVNVDNTADIQAEAADDETNNDKEPASVGAISTELADSITYADELTKLDSEVVPMFIDFGSVNISDMAVYESSGATAEEIIVLECASSEDAKAAVEVFNNRISEQKTNFENYVPEELVKLDAAVIVSNDNYAVLSVSDEPDKAREILNKYF